MKVSLLTFGCKLNRFETMAMAEALEQAGHLAVGPGDEADVYVVNTCTVTAKSDMECRKAIRRLARVHPGAAIVAAGCYADRDASALAGLPGVRLVLGNREKAGLPRKLAWLEGGPEPAGPAGDEETFPLLKSFGGRARAFVKIQDGCSNRCAYCVVWQVRGPGRSESEERVVRQVADLARAGFPEIVLTGVHLGGWGADLKPPGTLASLLDRLAEGSEGPRLRLSSVEPNEFGGDLLETVARRPRICRHFHLPLQSGSREVLARMNRGYTPEDYARAARTILEALPGVGLGADVIAGFPGETEGEFAETVDLVESIPLSYLHVFAFSPRPGTAAASMTGQVPAPVRARRSLVLRDLGARKAAAFREGFIGRRFPVLVESMRDRRTGLLRGLADNYLRVLFAGPDEHFGRMAAIRADRLEGGDLYGTIV